MNLDKKDKAILEELQVNCKQTYKELSKKLNMPLSTIHTRISQLEKKGVIAGYRAIIPPEKIGRPSTVFTLVSIAAGQTEKGVYAKLAEEVANNPAVQEAYLMAGGWDIMLKIVAPSVEEAMEGIMNDIVHLRRFTDTQTYTMFRKLKDTTVLKL